MKKLLLLCILTIFFVSPYSEVSAQKKKNKSGDPEKPEVKKSKFESLTEGTEKIEGFFTFYLKDGHLYMVVPENRLNQNFLITYEIAQGIGARGLFGGTMLNIFEGSLVALEKHDGKIFLVQKPHRYLADDGTPQENAVNLTFGSSVLESAEIKTEATDPTILIDVYDWFVSDLSQISDRVKNAVATRPGQPGNASFDKSRSYLESVKSFPENSNIRAKLTFNNRERFGPREIPDSRYLPVSIHYSLASLPAEPMKPREADDRVGYFMTVHKDFTDDTERDFFKRYANRWRLECDGEPDAEGLCNVKQPIVYYIDRTVPEDYRQGLMAGVEAWGEAFQAAGFRNAIQAKLLPDGADPEDIRFHTLRWNTSDESGYGAIGPSVVDPRTGEILDADILFEANMILGQKNSAQLFANPTSAITSIFEVDENEMNQLQHGLEMKDFSMEVATQGSLLRTWLAARNEIKPDESVPDEIVTEFLKWVTMHEVGHTLGLRHNFRSSSDTPFEKLHDKSWTETNGVFSSVMEYPSTNLSPKGAANGHYYNTGVGSYDRWAISYGYTPSDEKAKEIARQSAMPGHAYGTDEDARGAGAIDPNVNVYDLSADPLTWGKERVQIINSLFSDVPQLLLADNSPYYLVTQTYSSLLFQYARALSTGIKYIGGQYQWRDHKGDPNERSPFETVSKQRQTEALKFLADYGFSEKAFSLDSKLYQQFGANRWSHWGNNTTVNDRVDYPYYEVILDLQESILEQLTNSVRLSRIRDAELRYGAGNVVGIPQMMNELTAAIWSEVYASTPRNISTMRRGLQRIYIDRITEMLLDDTDRMNYDASSVARLKLTELQSRINRRMSSSTLDDYTRAHLTESAARIEKALDAYLQVNR